MQTFMPYDSFSRSLSSLDNKRLGKQRVEAFQILKALADPNYGWQHHPAVKMWRGYEEALKLYFSIAISEWICRGFNSTMVRPVYDIQHMKFPYWMGNEDFHLSHRSNLIRKLPSHYKEKFGNDIPDNLPYVWPEGLNC